MSTMYTINKLFYLQNIADNYTLYIIKYISKTLNPLVLGKSYIQPSQYSN